MKTTAPGKVSLYDGEGDRLMGNPTTSDRITLLPDSTPGHEPDPQPHLRLMWGQRLLDDLLAGHYRSLVCGVNTEGNSHGVIGQLAQLLPTSQWNPLTITEHVRRFPALGRVTVAKFDMDMVEVLALLRPQGQECLSLDDLSLGFKIVAEMIARKPGERRPSATVSFLGARANILRGPDGREPSLEAVLRTMHRAGYVGDVYPAPGLWDSGAAVFARYPFPASLQAMREGGF